VCDQAVRPSLGGALFRLCSPDYRRTRRRQGGTRGTTLCPFASPDFCETSVHSMKQVAVVFHLHEGSEPEAAKLAGADPPFDPAEAGFARVAIFVTAREAIFVLEGEEPLWSQDELMNDFLRPALRARLDEWRKLADVQTWPAEPVFVWEASADQ
jgi:hypothetical protein